MPHFRFPFYHSEGHGEFGLHKRITVIFCLVLFLTPVNTLAYTWESGSGLSDWSFQNVKGFEATEDGTLIYKKYEDVDFMMSPPAGMLSDDSVVRIRLRTIMPGGVINCMLLVGDMMLPSRDIVIYSGRSWKDYVFDLSSSRLAGTPIERIVFRVSNVDYIEISSLQIAKPSYRDLFVSKGLYAYQINSTHPFRLYGYSLNLWFYAIIILMSLCVVTMYVVTKNRKVVYMLGITCFFLYLLYDVRENIHNMNIMRMTYDDFISAPQGQKRFFYWEELIEFAGFVKQNIPADEDTVYFFGDEYRFLYIRYLLYPLNVIHNSPTFAGVNIFHNFDTIRFYGDRLFSDGSVVLDDGRVVAYNGRSFIYIRK